MDIPKTIRLLVAGGMHKPVGGHLPEKDVGWAVCTGDVPKPRYRCEWCVVGFYKLQKTAKRVYDKLKGGRLMVRVDAPNVFFIPQTRPKADPLKAFRRQVLAAVGKPYSIEVLIGSDDPVKVDAANSVTVLAYPVGEHFAIHKTVEEGYENRWSVTHLPSLLGAGTKHKGKTIAAAIAFAMQRLPIPWSSSDPQNTAATGDDWKRAGVIAQMQNLDEVRAAVECEALLS